MHKTGIQILALDVSPYRTHAILAGREILKTIQVEDARCTEDFNLRSRIIAYASTHNTSRDAVSAQHKDQLSAYDVKWSHGKFDATIATAAANGRIIIYDLNSAGIELARLHEHTRQVHRLAFNPHQGALLLSASQDATVRMWDLRALGDERSVRTCGSIKKFLGNNEAIRDLRWSPSDGVEFAIGTDNGTVQRWDFRNDNAPLLKINAHEKTCHSIDWHPSGKYLASGGADRTVKIWNFKSSDRRMKPWIVLRAPQAIRNLRWRPGSGSPDGDGQRSSNASMLATTYDAKDPRIHVWDLARPHVPSQELDRYDTPATDMLWQSEDLLWSVGSTGAFTQTDLKFAPKPSERSSTNVLTLAPNGGICAFFDGRPTRRTIHGEPGADHLQVQKDGGVNDEAFSSSQSANEGSLEEPNLLNSSLRKRRQKNIDSLRANPTSAEAGDSVSKESASFLQATYQPQQSAFVGHVIGLFDEIGFNYLAQNYRLPSPKLLELGDPLAHKTIKDDFEFNADLAGQAGLYRLAQSWRIVGQAAYEELLRRARESKQEREATSLQVHYAPPSIQPPAAVQDNPVLKHTMTKAPETSAHVDNYSNMSTPLARPLTELPSQVESEDYLMVHSRSSGPVSKPEHEEYETGTSQMIPLSLSEIPQVAWKKQDASQEPSSTADNNSPAISFPEFPDLEAEMQEKRTAMKDYRAKPRAVLNLDSPFQPSRTLSIAPPLSRHDSNESFQMFSASAESDHQRSIAIPESFEERQRFSLSSTPDRGSSSFSRTGMILGSSLGRSMIRQDQESSPVLDSSQQSKLFDQTQISSAAAGNNIEKLPPVNRPLDPRIPKIYIKGVNNAEEVTLGSSLSEFVPSDFSPPATTQTDSPPWSIYFLIPPLLSFHLETLSDCQMPSILALHLSVFFPLLFPAPQTISHLSSYYEQLLSLRLYGCAAMFRKACGLPFPDIAHRLKGSGYADWYCRTCKKSVKGDGKGFCRRCEQRWAECPLCEGDQAFHLKSPAKVKASNERRQKRSISDLWTWCQGCGHGGHSPCLASWFADPRACEGTCPIIGCGHDCVEGLQREATVARLEREKSKSRRSVIKDDWAVAESRAVERTRGLVGSKGQSQLHDSAGGYRGQAGSISAAAGSGGAEGPGKQEQVAVVSGKSGGTVP